MADCSDMEIENPCDPCKFEKREVECVGYCVECAEYLCKECRALHKRFQVTRKHNVVEVDQKTKTAGITESCTDHHGRRIEYFCEDHQQLCCRMCLSVGHSKCKHITLIAEEAKGFIDGPECKQTEAGLQQLISNFESLKKRKEDQIHLLDKQKGKAIQDIKFLRKKIDELLDIIENDCLKKTTEAYSTLKSEREADIELCESVLKTLQDTSTTMHKTKKSTGEEQIFIAVKRMSTQTREYESFFNDCAKKLCDPNLKFQENTDFTRNFKDLRSMGEIINQRQQPTFPRESVRLTPSLRRKKAVPAGGQTIRIQKDKTTCFITGATFLDDGGLVLADCNNKSLKLFDPKCRFLGHTVLSSRPVAMTRGKDKNILTSLADEFSIQQHMADGVLHAVTKFKVDFKYSGIACTEKEIFATCMAKCDRGEIHVLDLSGNLQRIIGNNPDYGLTLIQPRALQVGCDGDVLYVLDTGKNCLFSLERSGRVVFTYTDRNLVSPNGLCVDAQENLYVSSSSNCVHHVSPLGQKIQEIIGVEGGISDPYCVAYSRQDDRLMVSEYKENAVKFFRLI